MRMPQLPIQHAYSPVGETAWHLGAVEPGGLDCSAPRLFGQGAGADADVDDRAGRDYVQAQLFGALDNLWILGARIQPQLVAPFGGDVIEQVQNDRRRKIDADPVQPLGRHLGQRVRHGQPFDLPSLGIHRIDVVSLLQIRERPCCRTSSDRDWRQG